MYELVVIYKLLLVKTRSLSITDTIQGFIETFSSGMSWPSRLTHAPTMTLHFKLTMINYLTLIGRCEIWNRNFIYI